MVLIVLSKKLGVVLSPAALLVKILSHKGGQRHRRVT